ncbi:hypothetical protein ABBQ32_002724 [Trebouxia sp. C0010 RCD-2024]
MTPGEAAYITDTDRKLEMATIPTTKSTLWSCTIQPQLQCSCASARSFRSSGCPSCMVEAKHKASPQNFWSPAKPAHSANHPSVLENQGAQTIPDTMAENMDK